MKPLKLVMSAFGPYKDRVEIDFEKIGTSGIFLITGDTGSGKTTIFDGISFALFGNGSGSRRESSSFRSDFATDDIKTYVHFSFFHKGVVYEIERIPKYSRRKVRGDGFTTVGGDANLIYLNEVITGDKNVTDKCIEILGMNASQFKQIVMIAQGEFMDLLLAKPRDRAEILRHIFDTSIYKNISDSLKNYYLEKKREYEDHRLSISNYLSNIIWNDGVEVSDDILDIMTKLDEENKMSAEEERALEKNKLVLEKKFNHVIKMISEGKLLQDSLRALEENKLLFKSLISKEEDIKNKEEKVFHSREIWDKVYYKKNQLDSVMDQFCEKSKELEKNKKSFQQLEKSYQSILEEYKKLDQLRSDIDICKDEKKLLEEKLLLLNEINSLDKELLYKQECLDCLYLKDKKQLILMFQNCHQLENKLIKLKENFLKKKDRFIESEKKYLSHYDLFISSQAGILAESLKDGYPCPVCGSLDHPKRAVYTGDILSKESLDEEKKGLDMIKDELDSMLLKINEQDKEYAILVKELEKYDENVLQDEIKTLSTRVHDVVLDEAFDKDSLENELSYLNVQLEEKKKIINENDSLDSVSARVSELDQKIQKTFKNIEDITQRYEKLNQEKVKLESFVEVLQKEVLSLEKEIDIKNGEYVSSYQELGYQSESDYLDVWLSKEEIKRYEEDINQYKESVSKIKGNIDTLESVIKGKKQVNLDELEVDRNEIDKQIKDIDLSLKNIHSKLSNNIKIYSNIKDSYHKLLKLEHEVMVYKDLSDTANGSITGKNKLEFEQFVQASYFDQVISEANKRFSYMTLDRYQLLRKDESTKISDKLGLELEVLDYYTGKKRDIKSLSGGESFKAALSLALGMSDTIQMYSGGVVVEAMFIDEGFGSLDDESLEAAMNAIVMLSQSNRVIGIISHVTELKSRIDKKIIVEKTNTGSYVNVSL